MHLSRSKLYSPEISQPASSNKIEALVCMDPLREGVKHASAEPPVTTRGRLSSLFSGAFPGKFSCIRSACSARRSLQGRKSTHSARIHIINRAASIYCKTSSVPGRNRASTEWFWLGSRRMSPAAQHPEIASAGAALPHNALHGSFLATFRRTASAPRRWGPPQPSRLPALCVGSFSVYLARGTRLQTRRRRAD